ncbi:MAG: hypothetical protein LC778_03335 [Acidobacteria bacterium]|nr:hypothetical protein [Acidobacteriota bacterium]
MRLIYLFFVVLTAVSCSQNNSSTTELQNQNKTKAVKISQKQTEQISPKGTPAPRGQIPMPDVKDFAIVDFVRSSDTKDASGIYQPPYRSAEISLSLEHLAKVGEKISVIPLQVDFEPFEMEIKKVEEITETGCDEEKPKRFWNVEFEKITRQDFLAVEPIKNRSGEFPFDIFVIYPAVKFARKLELHELKKEVLPKNVFLNMITAAIDLTNDGKPDLLEASFCCSKANKTPEDCDYTCGRTFKKTKGVWKQIKYLQPC